MLDKCINGIQTDKFIIGKSANGRNKWKDLAYRKPVFPLIEDNIYKDSIVNYWEDKPVKFAPLNNCIGCFHRNNILLKKMQQEHPSKFEWFIKQEQKGRGRFKDNISYKQIKSHNLQNEISFDDFTECDSGYCGL